MPFKMGAGGPIPDVFRKERSLETEGSLTLLLPCMLHQYKLYSIQLSALI